MKAVPKPSLFASAKAIITNPFAAVSLIPFTSKYAAATVVAKVNAWFVWSAIISFAVMIGLVFRAELGLRNRLLEFADACMLGDDAGCHKYDEAVAHTATWKLKIAGIDN